MLFLVILVVLFIIEGFDLAIAIVNLAGAIKIVKNCELNGS